MKAGKAEAVMDALAENSPQMAFPLQNQDISDPLFMQFHGCRESGRSAAYDHHIFLFHA